MEEKIEVINGFAKITKVANSKTLSKQEKIEIVSTFFQKSILYEGGIFDIWGGHKYTPLVRFRKSGQIFEI